MKRILIVGSTIALFGLVAACGGAAPEAAAPSATPTATDPKTIEEAQAQIASANDELGGPPGGAPAKQKSDSPAAEAQPKPAADAPSSSTPAEKSGDSCVSPCRALASMRRAVDALCRMAGDTDKRCIDARQTLADSVTRTSACKCSS